jgi:hypothetical protein
VLVTVRGALFLGIGAMVGAGIFALLGEAAIVAGSAVWLLPSRGGRIDPRLGPNAECLARGRGWAGFAR